MIMWIFLTFLRWFERLRQETVDCNMSEGQRLERLTSILRRRGVILPSFEIYGGVSGLIDYGPVGARIKRKVINSWINHWMKMGNVVEVDSPTITPESVLIASGHVGEFNDLMIECRSCNNAFRADHLIEHIHENSESIMALEMDKIINDNSINCPNCNELQWDESKPMNLMFKTGIGAMKDQRTAYMRPETAQGMFMLFPSLYRHFRQKLPFGAIQTGKGYRNEISPRQGMIRLREFNMAELEYFIDPQNPPEDDLSKYVEKICMIPDPDTDFDTKYEISFSDALEKGIIRHSTVAFILQETWKFLIDLGLTANKIRFRQHTSTEMAHYASDCWDCEIHGEYGWIECVGIANRTCHDLQSHENYSGTNSLRAWRSFDEPQIESKKLISPKTSVIGPIFKGRAGMVINALKEYDIREINELVALELSNGDKVEISKDMFEINQIEKNISGEWFIPHIIEPAFGIDRIIWHLLDHSYEETQKEGENYSVLKLNDVVCPIDAIILPLFEKDGMGEIAFELTKSCNHLNGIKVEMDTSKSIGRRYARADEIGIPWAVTVDHTSLEDNTVTIRRRDDQVQIRVEIDELLINLRDKTIENLYK
jgi:glycyl-tRNA synthetase